MVKRVERALRDRVGYHDLMADLKRPGCPVCHGAHRSAWRYLDSMFWEFVNDPGVRARLRASHGFCREHSRMALAVVVDQSAGLGAAILYEDLLHRLVTDAEAYVEAKSQASSWGRRRPRRPLAPTASCPACESAAQVAENYLAILADASETSDPGQAIRRPGVGLCAPHLAVGLRRALDAVGAERLLDAFRRGAQELRGELREYIRKLDYRFHDEKMSEGEATAWRRAIQRMAGEPVPMKRPER